MNYKHMLLMAVGCLIPLGALAAIYFLGLSTNIVLLAALIIICPLSHVLMMKYMSDGHESQPKRHDHLQASQRH